MSGAATVLPAIAVGLVAGVAAGLVIGRFRRRAHPAVPGGSHDELLERSEHYRDMVAVQTARSESISSDD